MEEFILTSCKSSQQFSVCLWDYNTLNVHKHYKNGGIINSNCLEVLGEDYLLGGETGKPLLHLWQLNSQEVVKNIRLILPEPASCLTLCPKNTYLAIGIGSKSYIWHISSGKLLSVQKKHYQPITCIKFSSNSEFLLVAGADGMLVTYRLSEIISLVTNLQSQDKLGEVKPVYTKMDHLLPIKDIHVGCFGRKSRFATVSADHTCRLYELINGNALLVIAADGPLTTVRFDAGCWRMFTGDARGNIKEYNLKNPPRSLTTHSSGTSSDFIGHQKAITCLDVGTKNILASGSEDGLVIIWDMISKQILKKIEHKDAVTNIKFVFNYRQFSLEYYKPKLVVKGLERTLESDRNDFVVSKVQMEDIELSDEEAVRGDENTVSASSLMEENKQLRNINQQLYLAALEISKRYNNVK